MHEWTSIIMNSFHLFQQTLFNKGFVVEGERGVLKKQMEINSGRRGVKPTFFIYLLTLFNVHYKTLAAYTLISL